MIERITVIRPAARWPHLDLRELWHYRELLGRFVWRDVKVRYKQTFLGVAWAICPVLHGGRLRRSSSGSSQTSRRDMPYPMLRALGLAADAVLHLVARGVEHEPRRECAARHEGLLPARAAAARRGARPDRRPAAGIRRAGRADGLLRHWPVGHEVVPAPLFLVLAFVTALGARLVPLGAQRPLPRRAVHVPSLMQVLPLVSGVPYAIQEIPVKWQWMLAFNPMTGVISGWRWAVVDARHRTGASHVSVAVGVVIFLSALRSSARPSRGSRTRSDGCRDHCATGFEAVSHRGAARRLRHAARLDDACDAASHRARAPSPPRGDLGAGRRLLRGRRGRGARRHRAQRRGQVDAAQGADADHDADERPRRDPWTRRQPARGRDRLPSRADRPRERLPERRRSSA